jgi:hypothetical protein
MRRNWIRRAAVAAALAAMFALAAPAQAAGRATWTTGPDLIQKAWQWIARLWSAPEGVSQPARSGPGLGKAGSGIDPMGGNNPSPPPPSQNGAFIEPMGS